MPVLLKKKRRGYQRAAGDVTRRLESFHNLTGRFPGGHRVSSTLLLDVTVRGWNEKHLRKRI